MVEKNLIKVFLVILLLFVVYTTGLWLVSEPLYAANIAGLVLLFVGIPSLLYRMCKHIYKYFKNKQEDENNR